jgi:probable phosphoglycerate mutase
MVRLLLVRHGETRWNEERRVQGAGSDTELNERGRAQAERLGLALRGEDISAVYSSPLQRAMYTAEAISRHHGLLPRLEPRLAEIDAGELEGRTVESLGHSLSHFLVPEGDGGMPHLPGGEGLDDLQERAWSAIQEALSLCDGGQVVVVSHYFTTLAIICRALGFPLATLRRMRAAPGSISALEFSEQEATLLYLNDTCWAAEEVLL